MHRELMITILCAAIAVGGLVLAWPAIQAHLDERERQRIEAKEAYDAAQLVKPPELYDFCESYEATITPTLEYNFFSERLEPGFKSTEVCQKYVRRCHAPGPNYSGDLTCRKLLDAEGH